METLEVADNDKPEDLKPKVSVVKERLETGYYSMKSYLDTLPLRQYSKDERKAMRIIIDSLTEALTKYSDKLKD